MNEAGGVGPAAVVNRLLERVRTKSVCSDDETRHLTTPHGYAGEVQYLFVAPEFRRRGVATALLRLLADWLGSADAQKVCVCVDADSPAAKPFYESAGASPFKRFWYGWDDISVLRS